MFCNNCGKEFKNYVPYCDNCGAPLQAPAAPSSVTEDAPTQAVYTQQPAAPVEQAKPQQKKKGGKVIAIAVVAVLLVAAIVCGIIWGPALIAKIKGGSAQDEDGEVNDVELSAPKTPQSQTFDALMTTLFDSKELKIRLADANGEYIEIIGNFGADLKDSTLSWENNIPDSKMKITLKNSELYVETPQMQEGMSVSLEQYLTMMGVDQELSEIGFDASVIELLDLLINNKLDKKQVSKIYDEEIRPMLEESLTVELEETVMLPTFDATVKHLSEFLRQGLSEEALTFTETDSGNGKTYAVKINAQKLIQDIGNYAKKNKDLNAILEAIVSCSEGEIADVDELISIYMENAADFEDELNLRITTQAGRLTCIAFGTGEDEMTLTITSK